MFLVQLLDDPRVSKLRGFEYCKAFACLEAIQTVSYSIGPLWRDSDEASVSLISKLNTFQGSLNPMVNLNTCWGELTKTSAKTKTLQGSLPVFH